MAYAEGREFYDADSHIMELPDHLTAYADPAIRGELPELSFASGGKTLAGLDAAAKRGGHDPAHVEKCLALGDRLIAGPKGYLALGAFNGDERRQALDLLGFQRQLVFPTFSAGVAFHGSREPRLMYGAARAANRAMAEFSGGDPRLMGVATVPLADPARAIEEIDWSLEAGLAAAWIPHAPSAGRSPGHEDLDPFWARLEEAGMPFVLHVGGTPLQLDPAWMNTGRPVPTDWLGGGENVRGKDMTSLHHGPETFLGVMVLDGVLERHPGLRGGAIELGAGWVPQMLDRLDWVADIWKKTEPDLAALARKPSEQIVEQLRFTPFVYENVGRLIEQSDDRLYLFSSDYPHFEGGRNPLGRFGRALEGHSPQTLDRFYCENFASLFGL